MMKRRLLLASLITVAISLIAAAAYNKFSPVNDHEIVEAITHNLTQGVLHARVKDGEVLDECKQTHTDIKAEVSGQIDRVNVTQEFQYPQLKLALDNLYPGDSFNPITFSGERKVLFPQPVPATRENLLRAQDFLASRQGSHQMVPVVTETAQTDGEEVVIDICVTGIWRMINPVIKVVLLILLFMSIWAIVVMFERLLAFGAARAQSREFAPKLAIFLASRKIDDAISLSEKYNKSHLALIANAGLKAIRAQLRSSDISGEVIDASKRALQRATAIKIAEFKRGLPGLRAIAATAPLVGFFGTVFGLIDVFEGMHYTTSSGISAVSGGVADALLTTGMGMAMAIPVTWLFNYLTSKVDNFLVEIEITRDELIDFLLKQDDYSAIQYRERY